MGNSMQLGRKSRRKSRFSAGVNDLHVVGTELSGPFLTGFHLMAHTVTCVLPKAITSLS